MLDGINVKSPLLSDQVIFDIPHMKDLRFNVRRTYLTLSDMTWDLDLAQ